ncbi:hypothetical protein DKP76_03240 [Falsochrobactrum shanghaiense]|uniref:Big-1 domain-containing protein n=1 Tax=Falsochrobactrum shanghaiense TaxID=2201899 RepID=A0A316JWQ0_9HYPH|nr:Ig-like domain-containing protein [Falsochrobactrum shanghaiense]PWL19570.1 hypothetical protein DKP76_03240 [Falsochrobactrum shanghaiense]
MTNTDASSSNVLPVDAKTTIEMVTDNSVANGNSENIAMASLTNAGDYRGGLFFTFNIKKGNATFVTTGQKTVTVKANPAYIASASFVDTSAETGEIEVYPTVNTALSDKTSYTFGAVPVKKDMISLKATVDYAIADGEDADKVTATLTDANNQPLAMQQLKFELPAGSGATFGPDSSPLIVKTDSTGQATVPVTLKSAQDAIIRVTCSLVTDASITRYIDIHFRAFVKPQLRLTANTTKDNAPANGTDVDTVVATLVDQNNKPVSGVAVLFDISPHNNDVFIQGAPPPQQVVTDVNGKATVNITDKSTLAESITVTASLVSDATVNDSAIVHFQAVVKPQLRLTANATKDNAPANGTDVDTVVATLVDQNNMPVSGVAVLFDISPHNNDVFIQGAPPPQQVVTDANGKATVNITDKSTLAESITVTASLVSDATVNDYTTIHFQVVNPAPPIPPPPPPSGQLSITFRLYRPGITQPIPFPNYQRVGTARAYVFLNDSNGRPAPNSRVYLFVQSIYYVQSRIVGLNGYPITPAPGAYAITDGEGKVQVNIAQWPGPNVSSSPVRLYANFTGQQPVGQFLPITFT